MNRVSMNSADRVCPHCGQKGTLHYYKETGCNDLYYCNKCFKCVEWNGATSLPLELEAYPNRDKSQEK